MAPTEAPTQALSIKILGHETVRITVAQAKYYSDDGAMCNDINDGPMAVTIHNHFATLYEPGQYTVEYLCEHNGMHRNASRHIIVSGRFTPVPGSEIVSARVAFVGGSGRVSKNAVEHQVQ